MEENTEDKIMINRGVIFNWKKNTSFFAIFAGFSILVFLFSSHHMIFVPRYSEPQNMYIYNKNKISINQAFNSNTSVYVPSNTIVAGSNRDKVLTINQSLLAKPTDKSSSGNESFSGITIPHLEGFSASENKVSLNVNTSKNSQILPMSVKSKHMVKYSLDYDFNSTSEISNQTLFNIMKGQYNTKSKVSDNIQTNKLDMIVKPSSSEIYSTPTKCFEKKKDVAFLKVHKAGSTTVMNIFLRYAISNNLNIVLPRRSDGNGFNYIGYGKTVLRQNIVPIPANETYNILCNHVLYDKDAFDDVMPKGSTYVSIIRDPVTHFQSASVYYGFSYNLWQIIQRYHGVSNTSSLNVLSEFLKNPKIFKEVSTTYVNNRMSYDFGIEPRRFWDEQYVDTYIKQLDKDFHLVMIMEYFYESLVLMKRILCWDIKDILYTPLNINTHSHNLMLSRDDLKRLKDWNSADFKLYHYFNQTFWSKVNKEGHEFFDEVKYFKALQENVTLFCQYLQNDRYLYIGRTRWNQPFIITKNECDFMIRKELPLVKDLILKAWDKYERWSFNRSSRGKPADDMKSEVESATLRNSLRLA